MPSLVLVMTWYFMHVRNGDELLDPEGQEYPTLEALKAAVLDGARALIAADAVSGEIQLNQRIDAEDRGGRIVWSLCFGDAVTFRAAEA